MDCSTTGAKYDCPAMKELRRLHSNQPNMRPFIDMAMTYLARFRDAHPRDYRAPDVDLEVGASVEKGSVYLEWAAPNAGVVVSFWDDGTTTFGRYRIGQPYERHHAEGLRETLGMVRWPDIACY